MAGPLAALAEFEPSLLGEVRQDVEGLRARYQRESVSREGKVASMLRDVPEIAHTITWCRQMERR